jgi:2',3'-cyclic-nucleotide 2'-phosphodiesterase (5'-nucleotidase family)
MTISNKTITRRAFVRGGAAGTLAAGLYACGSNDKTSEHGVSQDGDSNGGQRAASKLAIIHTTDTHGHDILDEESLGMAAVAQLKSDWEAKGYEVLLLDAGDAVQGDNLVNRSQGRTAIEFMNQVG